MIFEIIVTPTAKARPRVLRSGITYTPAKSLNYERQIVLAYQNCNDKQYFETEAISINIECNFVKVKSNKKPLMTQKPDVDNLAKTIMDALNGFAYKDDSQITFITVKKFWTDREYAYTRVILNKI